MLVLGTTIVALAARIFIWGLKGVVDFIVDRFRKWCKLQRNDALCLLYVDIF